MVCDVSLMYAETSPPGFFGGSAGCHADLRNPALTSENVRTVGGVDGASRRTGRCRRRIEEPTVNSDQWSISPTLGGVPRGDGRLNHDLLPGEKGPQDACGVFGVWAPGEEVAKLTYFGLYALQHRGQESAGIAVSNGSQILVFKDMGLVSQVFDETSLGSLQGHIAVGHARYSTTGASVWENAQPTFRATAHGSIALGHNGNLVNTAQLAEMVAELPKDTNGRSTRVAATNDTDLLTALLAAQVDDDGKPLTIEEAAHTVFPQVKGAFTLVFMDENTLYAARDPQGIRPLVLGRLERGWVVASETAALDITGASFVREIEPGEFVAIDENGLRSSRFAEAKPKGCVFEYVYLARPDTDIAGRNVYLSRVEMGRRLAKEAPAEADLVIATPESGTPAAIGYAEASGIPFGSGLVKNAYVGRTFIQPSQTIRQIGIRLKLNPLKEVIQGKRLVVVDDSIVRGNTQRALVRMLREAGAAEVHIRISSPPVKWPCFFGIDFATRAELIANGMSIDEIGASLGADSLAYISIDGMIEATTIAKPNLCSACFDGKYPMELPDPELLGKQLLETELAAGPAVPAAVDAIRRP
jgi:amidophosphoribosyltransferase